MYYEIKQIGVWHYAVTYYEKAASFIISEGALFNLSRY